MLRIAEGGWGGGVVRSGWRNGEKQGGGGEGSGAGEWGKGRVGFAFRYDTIGGIV